MNYLSVCSGIEAATVAWHDIGWNPAGFSEIEPFPSAVLSHHYPNVTNFGDMTKFKEWNLDPDGVDLLVGGTPCQSFSVAGLRKGLDDPRGNLALTYCSMLDHFRPTWFIWENVPGVLSSSGGRDFGSFLGAVAELGYGFAYRVLDAQYFGVAQRRRRVFVVGHLGNWQRAAAVLFERESLCRNTAPRRETWEKSSASVAFGVGERSDLAHCLRSGASRADKHESTTYVATFDRQSSGEYGTAPVASTMAARDHKGPSDLVSYGIPGNWIGRAPENGGNAVEPMHDIAPCLTKTDQHGVAHPTYSVCCGSDPIHAKELAQPITRRNGDPGTIAQSMAVRRLTPVECERLQGFPDNYTNIPWRKSEESPDGPRYKALGNSMAVPVMRWIGERINQVKEI